MQYKEFVSAMEIELNKMAREGVAVSINRILKNNTVWKYGVVFWDEQRSESPTIYLEEFFEAYQEGDSLQEIAGNIWCLYEHAKWSQIENLEKVLDFDYAKHRIVPKVINKEYNKILLKEIPYLEWMDLALVFYVLIDFTDTGMTTMLVKNHQMQFWGLSENDLFQLAMNNTVRLLPAELLPMSAMMAELVMEQPIHECNLLEDDFCDLQECMYILTNDMRSFGAVCMTYPHILEMIAGILEESYYILPSSIHEVLIVPESRSLGFKAFATVISEINMTQVAEEEILTDHAYYYDRENGIVIFGSEWREG